MNASYGNTLTVPEGFATVLSDLTREILRDQPNNIYGFAADYFQSVLDSQGNGGGSDGSRQIDAEYMESLNSRIADMFNAADEEGKGYLTRAQATAIVENVAGELQFSKQQVQYIMTEADENHDGMIDFNEFQPLLLELAQLLYAKQDVEEKIRENESKVEDILLHGMNRDDMNALLLECFQNYDTDQSGFLSRSQFQQALKSADIGLTRKEINGLLHEVDENEDGVISYEEFYPVAFDLCVQIYARQLAHSSLPSGQQEIAEYFEQLFSSVDVDGTGRLSYNQLGELLRASDLGMSKVQTHAVLGEAVKDEDNTVNYKDFAFMAAQMVGSMINFQDQSDIITYRKENSGQLINGMSESDFKGTLSDQCSLKSDDGFLSLEDLQDIIFSILPECSTNEMSAMLSLLYEEDETNGKWKYDDLIEYGYQVLLQQKEAVALRG
jgi:Ca2+-binding EF-hand superfamily protein